MVFALPSVVFAQTYTYELSQDCETAKVGTDHTITVEVTDESGAPVADVSLWYSVQAGPNFPIRGPIELPTNEYGITEFTYTGGSTSGTDNIWLIPPPWTGFGTLATISTEWTAEDLCLAPNVQVGGKVTLNAKKKGALKIAVCGTKDFEVSNVEPESVLLAGVAPWRWKQKDSKDLVFKFKNREVVEALGPDLEDTDKVTLALTGNLYDKTAFGGEWTAVIKKKGKRHGKNEQYQGHSNGRGKGPKK
jgi:hypothetical protein